MSMSWPRPASEWPVATGDGISAVIAHYGDPALTKRLVEQLKQQDYAGPVEIIVSDDASPQPFPPGAGYRVERATENSGYGAAINRGAKIATQPWLLILNSDVEFGSDFLTQLVSEAVKWQPAICGVRQLFHSRYNPAAMVYPSWISTIRIHSWLLSRRAERFPDSWGLRPGGSRKDLIEEVDWLVGSALFLPASLFRATGGFDERYFMYMEEVDLQRRLRLLGVPAVLLAGIELSHDEGQSSNQLKTSTQLLKSRLLFEEKWYGTARRSGLEVALAGAYLLDFGVDALRWSLGKEVRPARSFSQRLRTLRQVHRMLP